MKYALETLILILLLLLGYLIYSDNKVQDMAQYRARMEQLNNRFDSLQIVADSVTIIDKTITKKITVINNYYDSSKTSILSISDSAQFKLLWSNIDRYQRYLDKQASENH
jgi:NADH:ubiquinone oxidoreductase subunit H